MKSRFLLNRAGDCRFLNLDGGVPVGRAPRSRHHAMPTKDGFAPGHPLPPFLSEHADEPDRLRVVEARNRTGISSRVVLTTRALIGMATAIGILTVEDPVALFTTSLLEISALLPAIGQSTAAIQSTSDPENLPPTTSDAPTRREIAAALEPADQSQTKINPPSTEDLFKQFQAWAVAEDKRAKVEPAPPVQDTPEQVVQDARPNLEIMKTTRQVSPVRRVRAEVRPRQNSLSNAKQSQNGRVQGTASTRCTSTGPAGAAVAWCGAFGIRKVRQVLSGRCPQKIIFAQMREQGVRGVLIYCSDYHCSHWTPGSMPIIGPTMSGP